MDSKICKIVYFDDEAITDYVQIAAGGELQSTTELLNSREGKEKQSASAGAKGGIGGIFKALLGWEASANVDVSAELGFSSNKMVKNIVKNLLWTIMKLSTIQELLHPVIFFFPSRKMYRWKAGRTTVAVRRK